MIYHVTYRYGSTHSWSTRTMSEGEYLSWFTLVGGWCEYVVIPRMVK